MKLKLMFALLAVFLLILPLHAVACCDPTGGFCICKVASGDCTYTCNGGWYQCYSSTDCDSTIPCNHFAFQRFTFNLSNYTISSIKSITYCFRGDNYFTGYATAAYLEYYNVTSSSWVYDQPISTGVTTMCHTFTSITDVVNTTSNITQFAARGYTGDSGTIRIDADFVNLSINYGAGSPVVWTSGKFGNAVGLNGSQQITVNDSPSLEISGSLTVEGWINPSTVTPAYQTILTKGDSSNENYGLYLKGAELYFEWINSGVKFANTTSASLQANTWYHVAAVFNSGSYVKLYVNGVEMASSTPANGLVTNTAALTIGANNSNNYFNGTIDEAAVYSRAKSASEIYADANSMFVSLNIKDSLNNSVSARGATSGYINPGANNTLYLTTNNNGNLNMTVGGYAGTYSLRLYLNNTKVNLFLTTVQQGVSSIQAILPIQLQIYNQVFNSLVISQK
ncbi:LamG domain-containing protein [Candidatus Micrarchaeota archaeon]|nr:LamG domain-containing protein [Candidatus Micrarchaeota archaeon]